MNLAVLAASRRRLKPGDIFVMRPPDNQYLWGRVIDTNANPLGVGGSILIYVYRTRTAEKTPVPALFRGQLLIPPLMINRLPWSRGYFEHVESRPLTEMDRLPQHCFVDSRGWYFDEKSQRLPGPVEPVGFHGLHSYRTVDDEVSNALGIPLFPDE